MTNNYRRGHFTVPGGKATDRFTVEFDPLGDDGGFPRDASIPKYEVECGLKAGSFVDGTILRMRTRRFEIRNDKIKEIKPCVTTA